MVAEAKLLAEARRQLDNHDWSTRQERQEFPSVRQRARDEAALHGMISNAAAHLRSTALAVVAHYRLGDPAAARRQLEEAASFYGYYDDALEIVSRPNWDRSLAGRGRDLLEPLMCMVLAQDWPHVNLLADLCSRGMFPVIELKAARSWDEFTLQALRIAAGQMTPDDATRVFDLKPDDAIRGYEDLLTAIARCDERGFDIARARCEAEYPLRSKRRGSTINLEGYGKLGQLATFDVLGTVICRLARRAGIAVEVDSRLYPAEWIR